MELSEKKNTKASSTTKPTWFLATVKPKQEFRAVENLSNQNIECFCPSLKVEKITNNKKNIIEEALFKGYLFINISPDDPNWHKVRSTRGIKDWVRFVGKVAKIPTSLVNELKLLDKRGVNQLIKKMKAGDLVRVLSGPFEGLEGVFQKDNGDLRAIILVDFLGKSNQIKIEKNHLNLE